MFPATTNLTANYSTYFLCRLASLDAELCAADLNHASSSVTEVCKKCYSLIQYRCKAVRERVPLTVEECNAIRLLASHNMKKVKQKQQQQKVRTPVRIARTPKKARPPSGMTALCDYESHWLDAPIAAATKASVVEPIMENPPDPGAPTFLNSC
jgi:hypothetical protein